MAKVARIADEDRTATFSIQVPFGNSWTTRTGRGSARLGIRDARGIVRVEGRRDVNERVRARGIKVVRERVRGEEVSCMVLRAVGELGLEGKREQKHSGNGEFGEFGGWVVCI